MNQSKTVNIVFLAFLASCTSNPKMVVNFWTDYDSQVRTCFLRGKLTNIGESPITGGVNYTVSIKDALGNELTVAPTVGFKTINLKKGATTNINFATYQGVPLKSFSGSKKLCQEAKSFEFMQK